MLSAAAVDWLVCPESQEGLFIPYCTALQSGKLCYQSRTVSTKDQLRQAESHNVAIASPNGDSKTIEDQDLHNAKCGIATSYREYQISLFLKHTKRM